MSLFWWMFWWMMIGHAVCDYPLQGDFLARGKNWMHPIPGVPWLQCLVAHALIHAGAVFAITGRGDLAICEFVLHSLIDFAKCSELFGFNVDQMLHVACKITWALLASAVLK